MPLPSGEGTSETMCIIATYSGHDSFARSTTQQDQHAQKYGIVHGERAGLVWQIWLYWSQVSVTMKQTLKLIS